MSAEASFFSSNSFLRSLSAFVRRKVGVDGDAAAVSISAAAASSCEKPASLSCLSPEVFRRLQFVDTSAAAAAANAAVGGEEEQGIFRFGENGRVQMQWSLVKLAEGGDEVGEEDALAEGARLAVACHTSLRRIYQRQQQQQQPLPREETGERLQRATSRQLSTKLAAKLELPFADVLPGVIERILGAESDDEDVYVGLCVCLIVLERALYGIYRQRASSSRKESKATGHQDSAGGIQIQGEVSEGADAPLVAPAMILRDLIATPEVEAALPEQMLALLRLLLLPMGFNIRNLVWHGFLAPPELPRELASLVLLLTLSFPADSASEREPRETDVEHAGEGTGSPPPPPPQPKTTTLQEDSPRLTTWWPLDSFDGRLACPRGLAAAVESLLSARYRDELDTLVRRSAFVLPGREDVALLGLRALGDGGRSGQRNGAFLLVALLPVLEHGLRCLFCCANDSPGHLFAHLRQYYSTLDGFGQRAKHQLLLDQTLSGSADRNNLLLAALGPGLSAVLLDLFMMSSGPNLRGKVAHGEIDMARALPPLQSRSQTAPLLLSSSLSSPSDSRTRCSEGVGTSAGRSADIVELTAAVFLVLCRRYGPGRGLRNGPGDTEGTEPSGGGGSGESNPNGSKGPPPPTYSDAFVRALDAADASCSTWAPRFHPHELLEADLQDCRDEFDGLALALGRRVVSVDLLPGGDLARMTVAVLGGGVRCSGGTLPGSGEGRYEGKEGKYHASSLVDGRTVLTVTDSASRLVPPGTPATTKKKGHDAATGGVFPALARVNEALSAHALSLAGRFKNSAARRQRRETGTPASSPTSAFAAHYRCKHAQPDAVPPCDRDEAVDDEARRSRRISPPTNVITASPLPQMSCVSGLCRGCAEVARGLRERLAELEAPLVAGSARSKQRRAYATLLRVAPTLLRFLASAVAAVELFVIEWDLRTSGAPQLLAHEEEMVARAAGAGLPGPDTAAGLCFLRRLAAVNGTLCVTPGEVPKKNPAEPGSSSSSRAGMEDSNHSCDEGATGKKKGFAQALAELALFLETRTARQGFARRTC